MDNAEEGRGDITNCKNIAGAIVKAIDASNRSFLFISGCLFFILMFLISGDVIGRYVLSHPIPSTLEMAETLMVLAVFLGFAHSHAAGVNIRVDALTRRLNATLQTALEVFACCGGLILFALIVQQSWYIGWHSWQEREFLMGTLKIPSYVSKLAVPVGSFFLCVEFLREIIYKISQILMRKL